MSWRTATDLRRGPVAEWVLDRMDDHVAPGEAPQIVTTAAWTVVDGVRWDDPPSVPVLMTDTRLVIGHRRGPWGRRAEVRAWQRDDLTVRALRPLRDDAAYTLLELHHWTGTTLSLVFMSPAEAEVLARLLSR
jgi:hypothetical protein